MTNLLEIKPIIRNFVADNLDINFNAVYWGGERLNEPNKPFCILTELVENESHRTAYYKSDTSEYCLEEYKETVITVGVYVDGLNEFDTQKEFAFSQINNLKQSFKVHAREFLFNDIAIKDVSGIRPLFEEVEGGYLFRYEFDLTIGYNEVTKNKILLSNSIDMKITDDNGVVVLDYVVEKEED